MIIKESLAFDDVLVEPVYSDIRSRLDVDTSTKICGIDLKIPLISSPMDTVSGPEMIIAIEKLGGLGVLHRFYSNQEDRIFDMNKIIEAGVPLVIAIGVSKSEKDFFRDIVCDVSKPFLKYLSAICIDVANGHHILMEEMIKFVKFVHPKLPIMAGNVATADGFKYLADLGVSSVRCGIGSGSICSTRIQSACGVPLLTTLMDCYKVKNNFTMFGLAQSYPDVTIIADGGIKYPADLVKSLVAGADAIMAGSIFAGTDEAAGSLIEAADGKIWKSYRGAASAEIQRDKRGGLKEGTVAEGVSILTPYSGPLNKVVTDYVGGLRSGMTYTNSRKISHLRNANFIKITNSGITESHAHGTRLR